METRIDYILKRASEFFKNIDSELFIDDIQWNNAGTVVKFEVLRVEKVAKEFREHSYGTFNFYYNEDEEFYGTVDEQVKNWLENEVVYRF